jgi:hypothetical protein
VEAEARHVPISPLFPFLSSCRVTFGFCSLADDDSGSGPRKEVYSITGGMAVESSPGYKKRYRMAEGNMEEVAPYNDLSRMADREWIRGRELRG